MVTQIIDLKKNKVIKWRLTDLCNYNCSYCIRKVFSSNIKRNPEFLKKCESASPHIKRLADEIFENTGCPVNLDLIGGEISLFNLDNIFNSIVTKNIVSVNITSNMSADEKWYENAFNLLKKNGIHLDVCGSFHPEMTNLKDYFAKIEHLKDKIEIRCETVKTSVNPYVDEFISKCKELGVNYKVECNLLDKSGLKNTTESKVSELRYKIVNDDGTSYTTNTRNEFIKNYKCSAFPSKGYYCSRDFDYVYVEQNKVIGNKPDDENSNCKNVTPIEKFHMLKKWRKCQMPRCTICGHISLKLIEGENK